MSVTITVKIDGHGTRSALADIASAQRGATSVAANAARNAVQARFRELNALPNRLGGQKTGWWGDAAEKTQVPQIVSDEEAIISVRKKGVALKYCGGTVETSFYMTIPAIAAAHGKRAREISGLKVFWGRRGGVAAPRGLKDTSGTVWYWLVKSVTHLDHPDIIHISEGQGRGNSIARSEGPGTRCQQDLRPDRSRLGVARPRNAVNPRNGGLTARDFFSHFPRPFGPGC